MSGPTTLNVDELIDGKILAGFARIQSRIEADRSKSSNAMVSNYANRGPLLPVEDVALIIARVGDTVSDHELLELIDASITRVRPNSAYRASILFEARTARPLIMLNNAL